SFRVRCHSLLFFAEGDCRVDECKVRHQAKAFKLCREQTEAHSSFEFGAIVGGSVDVLKRDVAALVLDDTLNRLIKDLVEQGHGEDFGRARKCLPAQVEVVDPRALEVWLAYYLSTPSIGLGHEHRKLAGLRPRDGTAVGCPKTHFFGERIDDA